MYGIFEVGREDAEPIERYAEGGEAGRRAAILNSEASEAGSETRYRVKPIVDDSWKRRERRRRLHGEYRNLPDEVQRMADRDYPDHFAHASKSETGKVAYTESPEKGMQDRQTRSRPGAYIRKYWPDLPDAEVQRLALMVDNEAKPRTLRLAEGPDAIEDVYIRGPNSCMSYDRGSFHSSEHPVRVYAGPDLKLAYITEDDTEDGRPTGRALVWPEQGVYGRVYGDTDRMRHSLETEGFSAGSLDGARILKIENDGGGGRWVLPYIDDSYRVSDAGRYFVIDCDGEIAADRTDGVGGAHVCGCCEFEVDFDYDGGVYVDGEPHCLECAGTCEGCYEGHLYDDMTYIDGYGQYCNRCRDSHFTECEDCGEWIEDSEIVHHTHGTHCSGCFEDSYTTCVACVDSVLHSEAVIAGPYDEQHCACCAEKYEDEDAESEDAEAVPFA